MQVSLKNYPKLLSKVRQVIVQTKQNIVKSVDYEKVVMSWKIGKEIELHLKNKDNSGYGEALFLQLEEDTGIEKTLLYKMRAFYKTYPKIPAENKSLSWSHYRSLIAVKDSETRLLLENLVVKNSLGSDRLQKEIVAANQKKKKQITKEIRTKTAPLKFTRGKVNTYTVNEEGQVDLGFNMFFATTKKVLFSSKSDYTYKAKLERVVDGDTIHVKIDLGLGIFHHEILRLAKINAAESNTKEGRKATAQLNKILEGVKFLIVKTNKTDIYGRYIADVFFDETGKETTPQKVADSGIYLNQMLLDLGLAERF